MAKVQGVAVRVTSKKLDSGTYWSFCVDDVWYRTGKKKPPFEQGDMVRFEYEETEWGNQVDLKTVKSKKTEVAAQSAGSVAKGAGKKGSQAENWDARAKYWEKKDEQDIGKNNQYNYRAAYHSALELVNAGLDRELLTLKGGNSKPKQWASYLDLIEGVAKDLHQLFLSKAILEAVEVEEVAEVPVDDTPVEESKEKGDDWADNDDWDD